MQYLNYCMVFVFILLAMMPVSATHAATLAENNTKIIRNIFADGQYINWDGISNVCPFQDAEGNYCFGYSTKNAVVIVKTEKGKALKERVKLIRQNPLFGGVISDENGYYYVVTGKANPGEDRYANTIFISKYDSKGNYMQTVGNCGNSGMADWWVDADAHTKLPFHAGNCDIAINGEILTVNYARTMYNGHQSNSILTINKNTMQQISIGDNYNSHSFAQRVVPYKNGFLFASEGDAYDRAFTLSFQSSTTSTNKEANVFHFWLEKGKEMDMGVVNNNFAHMGGVVVLDDAHVALVGTSVPSMNEDAKKEKEQIFIQIFDPAKDLTQASAYTTVGSRSGYSGRNGDEVVTDYGVKWLTSVSKNIEIKNPQVVAIENQKAVILFEQYRKYKYQGIYSIILDQYGNIISEKQNLSKTAHLNPCEMPIFTNGAIYWTGNKEKDTKQYMYIFKLQLD